MNQGQHSALDWLVEYDGLVIAHGLITAAMQQASLSESAWAEYAWPLDDPLATAKPTWRRLHGAALQIAELDAYAIFRAAARAETKRRICQAYGVLDTENLRCSSDCGARLVRRRTCSVTCCGNSITG